METKEKKLLGIIDEEISAYEGMIESETKRIKKQGDPGIIAVEADCLVRYCSVLKELRYLKQRMEEEK